MNKILSKHLRIKKLYRAALIALKCNSIPQSFVTWYTHLYTNTHTHTHIYIHTLHCGRTKSSSQIKKYIMGQQYDICLIQYSGVNNWVIESLCFVMVTTAGEFSVRYALMFLRYKFFSLKMYENLSEMLQASHIYLSWLDHPSKIW
jgi:hypothetical protein